MPFPTIAFCVASSQPRTVTLFTCPAADIRALKRKRFSPHVAVLGLALFDCLKCSLPSLTQKSKPMRRARFRRNWWSVSPTWKSSVCGPPVASMSGVSPASLAIFRATSASLWFWNVRDFVPRIVRCILSRPNTSTSKPPRRLASACTPVTSPRITVVFEFPQPNAISTSEPTAMNSSSRSVNPGS